MADVKVQGATPPIAVSRLKQIANDACTQAFSSAEYYEHSKTAEWNTTIINSVLRSIISESAPSSSQPPAFKFAVTSTIIQHLLPTSQLRKKLALSPSNERTAEGEIAEETNKGFAGRRGMHSATGAYWNNEKDGMWSYKYESGESKGLDVVVTVIWISM